MRTDLYEKGDSIYFREFDPISEPFGYAAVERMANAIKSYGPFTVMSVGDTKQDMVRDADLYHPQLVSIAAGDYTGFWFKPIQRSNVILRLE